MTYFKEPVPRRKSRGMNSELRSYRRARDSRDGEGSGERGVDP